VHLIFVNYSHPEVTHVAATRLREFARALARRGHWITLVSSPRSRHEATLGPVEIARAMGTHDWQRPFHVACMPRPMRVLDTARKGHMPAMARRAVSLWSLVLGDGPWHDWVAGSKPYWPLLTQQFKPDLVFGNFGSVSDLVLAQALARAAGVPWCADIKDNMQAFLPRPTRPILARRFADVAGLTANSQFHAKQANVVFEGSPAVVYSGIDDALLSVAGSAIPRDRFRIMLAGSIYSDQIFATYLTGLDRFVAQLAPAQRAAVELCYAGHDTDRVRDGVSRLAATVRLDVLGYLSADALREAYGRAAVQSYIFTGTTFHHKALEMLASGRPVVAFPGEFDETTSLATAVHGVLHRPATSDDLAAMLSSLHRQWLDGTLGTGSAAADAFSWDAGAAQLERTFEKVLRLRVAGVKPLGLMACER